MGLPDLSKILNLSVAFYRYIRIKGLCWELHLCFLEESELTERQVRRDNEDPFPEDTVGLIRTRPTLQLN